MPAHSRFLLCAGLMFAGQAAAYGDPWSRLTQITSPAPVAGAHFGASVAMTDEFLVVGEPYATVDGLVESGQVYVFVRSGNTWVLQTRLFESLPGAPLNLRVAGGHFGAAVAISGEHILVGQPDFDCTTCNPVAPHIGVYAFFRYNRSLNIWTEQTGGSGDAANNRAGASVALSGTLAVIGAPGEGPVAGRAYVNEFDSLNWHLTANVQNTPAAGFDRFGASVAATQTPGGFGAKLIVVGAPGMTYGSEISAGSITVFRPVAGNWIRLQTLFEPNPYQLNRFGSAVALTSNRIWVGAPGRRDPQNFANQVGAVQVFVDGNAGMLVPESAFYAPVPRDGAMFGSSLTFLQDGFVPRLAIGVPAGDNAGAQNSGNTFVYSGASNGMGLTFSSDAILNLGGQSASDDALGTAVALTPTTDGDFYAAVGVPNREVGTPSVLSDAGAVEIYQTVPVFANGFE